MKSNFRSRRARRRGFYAVLGMTAVLVVAVTGPARGQVSIGTAENFAVLANTTITNTGPTTISGDVGLYPGTSVTGFTEVTLNGTLHVTDAVAQQALIDAGTAYGVLQGRTPCTDLTGEVLGQTVGTAADPLLPGVYCFSSSAQLTGDLYLSGGGEYIFQIGSTLTTASGSRVILVDGAEACEVFWAIGSSATLGTNSEFVGTLIANTSITANTGAVVEGRLLALTGAVTLDSNTVTRPVCDTTTTTTTLPATTTTTLPGTTTTALPGTTTTTLPGTTTTVPPITVPPITVPPITVPPITVPPTTITIPPITLPPIPTTAPPITIPPIPTTTTTTAPETTTTLAPGTTTTLAPGTTTTLAPDTTTTTVAPGTDTTTTTLAPGADTTTTLAPGTETTTTLAPATDTTSLTTTSVPATTTETTASLEVATVSGRTATGALPRTGSPVRWLQLWAGIGLVLGGVLVGLTEPGLPLRRRRPGPD